MTATDIEVTAADIEVIATDTDQKGNKGICLCKQETHVENSSRTIVKFEVKVVVFTAVLGFVDIELSQVG